nr:hypothetical protein [Tanacetum cinerariifolium]
MPLPPSQTSPPPIPFGLAPSSGVASTETIPDIPPLSSPSEPVLETITSPIRDDDTGEEVGLDCDLTSQELVAFFHLVLKMNHIRMKDLNDFKSRAFSVLRFKLINTSSLAEPVYKCGHASGVSDDGIDQVGSGVAGHSSSRGGGGGGGGTWDDPKAPGAPEGPDGPTSGGGGGG